MNLPLEPLSPPGRRPPTPRAIELRIGDPSKLFDPFDPSPLRERDLRGAVEEYVVDSLQELPPRTPIELVVRLDAVLDEAPEAICAAVQAHFARRARVHRRALRRLLRRGLISLAIGTTFLAAAFVVSQIVRSSAGGTVARVLAEGVVIAGWVAMWRPLETFLYDWWPLVGDARICERLSRTRVRVEAAPTP